MITDRLIEELDYPKLQDAIDRDTFHPTDKWTVEQFMPCFARLVVVFEDEKNPIVFVRFTTDSATTVRVSTVWFDETSTHKNARAIVILVNKICALLRGTQFTRICFNTNHDKLANFCIKVLGFFPIGDGDYARNVKD